MTTAGDIRQGTGSFEGLERQEPFPGVARTSFSTREATVSHYSFRPRASFPLHRHPQEQITLVEEGTIEMTIAGARSELRVGEWSVVAPDVEHGITAGPEGARIVAVVVPRRESSDQYTITGGEG